MGEEVGGGRRWQAFEGGGDIFCKEEQKREVGLSPSTGAACAVPVAETVTATYVQRDDKQTARQTGCQRGPLVSQGGTRTRGEMSRLAAGMLKKRKRLIFVRRRKGWGWRWGMGDGWLMGGKTRRREAVGKREREKGEVKQAL